MKPDSIAFIFLDGVGIGPAGAKNPFVPNRYPALEDAIGATLDSAHFGESTSDRLVRRLLDANLNVDGLPQSGTGQATLFTGVNCAELAGRHFGPYPHSATRATIAESNLFARLINRGVASESITFANAFPAPFFEYAARKNRWTVTTRCCLDAGIPLRTMDDLLAGKAIAADFTGDRLRSLGVDHDGVSAQVSGEVFGRVASAKRMTLCEYFLTDKAGHAMSRDAADDAISRVDSFVEGMLSTYDLRNGLVVITSDHGNVEDLGVRTHTRNPVPLIAIGAGATRFASARSLCDVVEPCVELLTG